MTTAKSKLQFHEKQWEVLSSDAGTTIVTAGRRGGKTRVLAYWFMDGARHDIQEKDLDESIAWLVAPTYDETKRCWKAMHELDKTLGWITNTWGTRRKPGAIELFDSALVEFKSADRPGGLVGEGLNRLGVDETGQVPEEIWTESLQPTRIDYGADALLVGTPKGKNWFYRQAVKGQDPDEDSHEFFSWSSYANPFIEPEEIEKIKQDMPDRKIRQEIYAEFLDNAGSVFTGLDGVVVDRYSDEPTVTMGIDLARTQDFTVIVGLDEYGGVTHFDRWQGLDWSLQRERIKSAMKAHGWPYTLVDESGPGDSFVEGLKKVRKAQVRGYRFTNQSKADLVEELMKAIDDREIAIPDEKQLVNELSAFEFERTPSGNIRYQAPSGLHDDCVDALALANFALRRRGGAKRDTPSAELINF